MKRLHVHLSVEDIEQSTEFYTRLFRTKPDKSKDDYVKWSLDNPPLNFAISQHGNVGLDHLGIEVENKSELEELYQCADSINTPREEQGETICCYARSEKSWVRDPQGINWELFYTLYDEETFNGNEPGRCCNNRPDQQSCC